MSRYIDADEMMGIIRKHQYRLKDSLNSTDYGMFTLGIQQAVDECKTINPEDLHPKGKWIIKMDENDVEYAQCSACGKELYDSYDDTIDILFNFCPNCGFRMVAVEREVLIEDL